jgi:hypothetical protein
MEPSVAVSDHDVAQLVSMGFSADRAKSALETFKSMDAALEALVAVEDEVKPKAPPVNIPSAVPLRHPPAVAQRMTNVAIVPPQGSQELPQGRQSKSHLDNPPNPPDSDAMILRETPGRKEVRTSPCPLIPSEQKVPPPFMFSATPTSVSPAGCPGLYSSALPGHNAWAPPSAEVSVWDPVSPEQARPLHSAVSQPDIWGTAGGAAPPSVSFNFKPLDETDFFVEEERIADTSPLLQRVAKYRNTVEGTPEDRKGPSWSPLSCTSTFAPERSDAQSSSGTSEPERITSVRSDKPMRVLEDIAAESAMSAEAPVFVPGQSWSGKSRSGFME